jgi:hypothetical protein
LIRWFRAPSTNRSKSSKSWNGAEAGGTGSKRTVHGIRSITPHSTAFLSTVGERVRAGVLDGLEPKPEVLVRRGGFRYERDPAEILA